ncbi:ABC transporter permease [Bacteroidota bacterium]
MISIRIFYRNFTKNKIHSLVNILGLSTGMAACILIFIYVSYESSYDKFHKNRKNLFRITSEYVSNSELIEKKIWSPAPLGPLLKAELPEVIEYARIQEEDEVIISFGANSYLEDKVYYADSSFFSLFSFNMLEGDPDLALKDPKTAIISESKAEIYFGDTDPIGKLLKVDDGDGGLLYEITGIFEDIPDNSHIKFDFLLSINHLTHYPDMDTAWWDWFFITYIQINPGDSFISVENKIDNIIDKYNGHKFREFNFETKFSLQNVTDIYLESKDIKMEIDPRGSKNLHYYLISIAIVILFLAWFNYINLTISLYTSRAKEVSIRKLFGAKKTMLMFHFLIESFLLNLLALAVALTLVDIFNEYFEQVVGKPVQIKYLINSASGFYLTLTFLTGSILSGIYPAFIQTSFNPVSVLKKDFIRFRPRVLSKILITLQFVISFIIIGGLFIIINQINFMNNADLGFDKENIILVHKAEVEEGRNFDFIEQLFFEELKKNPLIENVTLSFEPGRDFTSSRPVKRVEKDISSTKLLKTCRIDHNFLSTYNINLIEGRNFYENIAKDINSVIINERALNFLGFKNKKEAIGKELLISRDPYLIVGVAENFHQQSLKFRIEPVIFLNGIPPGYYAIKISDNNNNGELLEYIKSNFIKFLPGNPFINISMSDYFKRQYILEESFANVVKFFAFLAIIIAILGQMSLTSQDMIRKTKIIAIMKAIGANTRKILFIYWLKSIWLILIAILLAVPVTYFILSQWLSIYAYRIEINIFHFVLPAMIILIISSLTIGYQVFKTVKSNPIDSLRYE